MSYPSPLDIGRDIATGLSSLIKHGNNADIGTIYEPISTGGALRLPTPANAVALRVVSTSANDTSAGTGARSITIRGLDATGAEISETLETAGLTQSAYTSLAFWRVNFVDVVSSGVYATATQASHAGDLTISDSGGNVWAMISLNGYGHARFQSSWFTVPLGYRVFVNGYRAGVESNKQADIKLLARQNALTSAAPFPPMVELTELNGVSGPIDVDLPYVFGPIPALTDLGAMAKFTTGSGRVSFDFDFILERL